MANKENTIKTLPYVKEVFDRLGRMTPTNEGRKEKDYYLYCTECAWRSERNVIMKPFCPECKTLGKDERLMHVILEEGQRRGYPISRRCREEIEGTQKD